jgi:alanyl-tRNA synthetase
MKIYNGNIETGFIMIETVKLYDLDAYQTEFIAKVVSCELDKKGLALVLDQTLFFPEEGGQSPDVGEINGYQVIDVQIKNGIITHFLKIADREDSLQQAGCNKADGKELQPGCQVKAKIDWNERFSNMQNHTGEHILSGLIHKHYGYENVGFHLSPQVVTMDMNGY